MDRDKQIVNLRAQYEGATAGLQWLLNELYYFSDVDVLICEHCGDEFWVPIGDFVRLDSKKKGTVPHIRGGWAGRKNMSGEFPNLCEDCLQAVHEMVAAMKTKEKESEC